MKSKLKSIGRRKKERKNRSRKRKKRLKEGRGRKERELTAEGTVDPVKRSEEGRGEEGDQLTLIATDVREGELGERREQEMARELEKRGELVSGTLLVTACLQLCPPNLPLRG